MTQHKLYTDICSLPPKILRVKVWQIVQDCKEREYQVFYNYAYILYKYIY